MNTEKGTQMNIRKLTQMAVLAAISVVLVYLVRFPIFPSAPFLEYDPADISLILGAFIYGPVAGLLLTAVVCIVQGVTVSAQSGIIGIVMHFLATGSFVLVAGLIYKRNNNLAGSIIALVAGVLTMCATMVVWNIIITPIHMGVPRQVVLDMILPVILPFNLIKATANAAIAFIVFKSIGKYLMKQAG